MDTDYRALLALAQAYFDAAYEMDIDKFAYIFEPSSSVTKVGEGRQRERDAHWGVAGRSPQHESSETTGLGAPR